MIWVAISSVIVVAYSRGVSDMVCEHANKKELYTIISDDVGFQYWFEDVKINMFGKLPDDDDSIEKLGKGEIGLENASVEYWCPDCGSLYFNSRWNLPARAD